jgi:hypothetical protein
MKRITIQEESVISNRCFQGPMYLLLEIYHMSHQIELGDLVLSRTLSKIGIQCIGIKHELDIERQQIQRDQLLFRHKKTNHT